MQNLTLQQLFGVNVVQSATQLLIQKSDLPLLTPSANNSAESLLVALIIKAWNEFEGEVTSESDLLVDETGTPIGYDQREIYEKINLWFWRRQFVGGKMIDTFIINVFISPSLSYGTALSANQL